MLVRYLLDENLRGILWGAILQHNRRGLDRIDCVRVGDPEDLPRGSTDPAILGWAARENRVIVSLDKRTMPPHAKAHMEAGGHLPGVLLVRPHSSAKAVVRYLSIVAHATELEEWVGRIEFIP
jgi:hypothetical protein